MKNLFRLFILLFLFLFCCVIVLNMFESKALAGPVVVDGGTSRPEMPSYNIPPMGNYYFPHYPFGNVYGAPIYAVGSSDKIRRLKTCKNSNFKTQNGDVKIRQNSNGSCYYAVSSYNSRFECNFPMDIARKYSSYMRAYNLTNREYSEMKSIEKKYCRVK